jgi:hypothetical protein
MFRKIKTVEMIPKKCTTMVMATLSMNPMDQPIAFITKAKQRITRRIDISAKKPKMTFLRS